MVLDTNIIVDALSKRDGYENSLRLIKHCELKTVYGFVSASTVTDVVYVLRKYISPSLVLDTVQTLLLVIDVADTTKDDIILAFLSTMRDYEDAVQASCAIRTNADYIVTRNLKDFEDSPIRAISPKEALALIELKNR